MSSCRRYRDTPGPCLPNPVPTQDKASQTKPKRMLAATFCGYSSKEEEDLASLEKWDTEGDVHNLPVIVSLREELRMQMWSIHTSYDCACKVLVNHKDLQRLPDRQAKGALQKIWCDWTFSNKKTRKDA